MKLDIYTEQYQSKQAQFEAGKLGEGSLKSVADLGNTALAVVQKKREQDDEFTYASVYAQTMEDAAKMRQAFKETANPDNFEMDIENQKQGIQGLISDKMQNFKTPAAQNAFRKQMLMQLEPAYMDDTLKYSYAIQEQRYKKLLTEGDDQLKAGLLSGNTLMTLPNIIEMQQKQSELLGKRYHVDRSVIEDSQSARTTDMVDAYAYGMVTKDPYIVRDLMTGSGLDKFKAYKESIGEGFTAEEFLVNDDLRKEYAKSEFGAQFTDYTSHLDFEKRKDLWQLANSEITRIEKEKIKANALKNSISEYDLDNQLNAGIAQAELSGTLPSNLYGVKKITSKEDPRLGGINSGTKIKMGEAMKGPLAKGNSFTQQSIDLSNALQGVLGTKGYTVARTSSLRPGDKGSAHQTGSAIDIQVFRKDKWSEQGLIEAYKTALKLYPDKLRKGKSIFEVDPDRLPYIKADLEKDGQDTSFIDWAQSKKYGAIAKTENSQHLHLGIDPKADYTTIGLTGQTTEFTFKTPQGYQRYLQQMAAGKDPQECYDAGRKDDLKLRMALDKYNAISSITTAKNSDGSAIDPAQYGKIVEARKQAIMADKSMSSEDRLRAIEALKVAQTEIPKLQQSYREDTVDFLLKTNQASNAQEAAVIQAKRYGISPENILTMTKAEAQVKADQLYSKFSGQQAVDYVKGVNPASLRQLSKLLPNDSKSNMIMYSAMASPSLTGQFVGAIQNWDTVQKAINQDHKTFPTDWKAAAIGEFNKNPLMKNYFADLAKTNPSEQLKMQDALASVYAYNMAMGNSGRNSKEIIKDIAQNIIGNNYTSVTVANPRHGNTQLNIANSLLGDKGSMHKIQRVASIASKLGINSDSIYTGYDILNDGVDTEKGKELIKAQEQNKKHYLESIQKTTKLSSTPDGLNGVFTWQDSKGRRAGAAIVNKDTKAPFQIPYKDKINIYNEAYALKEKWAKGSGANRYYEVPRSNSNYKSMYPSSQATAMDAAVEIILTKKYSWLNKGSYGK